LQRTTRSEPGTCRALFVLARFPQVTLCVIFRPAITTTARAVPSSALRICASDDDEGYCYYHPLLNTPAGDCDPGRVGHGTMDGARGAEGR
jgi:hypothetical protein